ncbi:MAG: hypothetical protein KC618_02785, partial [Candidatus Omnitrophica bacterium]|nr:hypothetical protein [Candidatus Omnitrophota bacterium]
NSMPANLRGSVNVTVTIDPGVGVYSPSLAPAMTTGDFPLGSTVRIINNGYIEGRGGNGGPGQFSEGCPGGGYYRVEPGYGRPGGDALFVTYPVTIDNSGVKIYAGGGGGGSGAHKCTYNGTGGGGGGAGWTPGRGGVGGREVNSGWPGRSGTHDVGGAGGRGQCGSNGGRGGNPGQPGRWGITDCASNGSSRPGQPGVAVRGSGLITWSPKGDVRGSEIPF